MIWGGEFFLKIKKLLLDFIFPLECLGCKKDNAWLCENCLAKLKSKTNKNIFIDKNAFLFLDGVFSVFNYEDDFVKKLIKTYKYNFIKDIGAILADCACLFLKNHPEIGWQKAVFVPVPLHKKRQNWRGFNQAEIIAEKTALNLASVCETKKLLRIKNNKPQAKLNKEKRRINLKNCFLWQGENLAGAKIFLIDDVATTGATLDDCARALKKAGAGKIYGLVIAHGQ